MLAAARHALSPPGRSGSSAYPPPAPDADEGTTDAGATADTVATSSIALLGLLTSPLLTSPASGLASGCSSSGRCSSGCSVCTSSVGWTRLNFPKMARFVREGACQDSAGPRTNATGARAAAEPAAALARTPALDDVTTALASFFSTELAWVWRREA